MLLQFITARLILQVTTICYLQFTIELGYYNSRQLLLQFTTGIKIHDIIKITKYSGALICPSLANTLYWGINLPVFILTNTLAGGINYACL